MESLNNKNCEPPMLLQRPSLGRSQDVSHVLASAFRDLKRESQSVGEQTVKNLTVSRCGEESYHEEYVERLVTIQAERQRQLDELAMLETHIMQARAAATAAEEQEIRRAAEEYSNYESLGLPPGSAVPSYARPTTSSMMRYNKEHIPDNYDDDAETQILSNINSEIFMQYTDKDSSQASKPKTATCKSKMSSSWRESIKPDQRHRERTGLQRLNAKAEYLRNPRSVPPSYGPTLIKSNKKTQKTSSKESNDVTSTTSFKSSDILVPSPSPVIFKVYEIGEVYEMKLELKNVSSAMRQIRVIPPATNFFSIGLGQYPGEHGMIAPGMSCQFAVKFAPDSLMDFEDKIQIRTQLDDFLEIMLLGKRKPPKLTLSSVIDLGFCLVGGKKNITLNCLNIGGAGKFCFIEESKWPTTSHEWTLDNPGFVDLEPFCLKPAMFQLFEGQEMSLQVTFHPQSAKFYKSSLFLVCDNCQVKQFTLQGVGQTARVEFVSVDGGVSQSVIGESRDPSANYLVRFEEQNPCTSRIKNLLVKNMSNVALPFHWDVTKPNMRNCEAEFFHDSNRQHSIHKDSVFRFYPDNGVLQPGSNFEFRIDSSPDQVGNFNGVGHLVLEKVPLFRPDETINQTEQDVTAMKIEFRVLSKPLQVMVSPPVLRIPGKLLVGKLYKYHIKIKNNSVSKARFEWQTTDNIAIAPCSGSLDVDEEKALEMKICGHVAGIFETTVHCHVLHSTQPIYVHIRTEFEGPKVAVDNPDQDFGLVRLGDSATRTLLLTNTSELAAFWSLREHCYYHLLNVHEDFKEMPSEFEFIPDNGELPPFSKVAVDVVFTPLTSRRVRSVFECTVINTPPSFIRLTAEVQTPKICTLSSVVKLEDVYVDVPLVKEIEMENKTLLKTKFRWNECIGNDSEYCIVQFKPNEGILGPRERRQIVVLLTCSKRGPLQDLVAVCDAEGMEESVYLTFKGTISGLEVSFRTETVQTKELEVNAANDDLSLDFGLTTVGETPKTSLIITNKTAIKTTFQMEMEHFHAGRTPTPPLGAAPNWKTRGTGILAKTPNISDPFSKTPAKAHTDYCRSVLRDGRGAAFVCSPACGELEPFQEQIIEVTAYSDMWGEYKDNVICKINGLKEKRIPVMLNVDGCPLSFQMTKDKSPVVRFGTHVSGAPPVERVLRVNNNSSSDIRIDWEVYNEEQDDNQLIDLIVDVGNPFPKLVKGKETEDCLNKERQLITVDVKKHIGRCSNSPFSVKPSQQIVPARKHSEIKVTFDPSNRTTSVSCSSFILGFINLDNPKEIQSEHIKRCVGRDKDPFRFNVTGGIKAAVLSFEIDDDEGSLFKVSASDLLKLAAGSSVEVMKEVYKKRYYTLCNTTQATVSFSLVVGKPFCIVDVCAPPSANQRNSNEKKCQTITLKPQKNVQVGIAFCLSSDMLQKDNNDSESVTGSCGDDKSSTMEIQNKLEINFLNKTSQTLPLFAHVSLPCLVLSMESVDFGLCLIGQPKELNVQLTNFGESCSQWFVEKDPQYPEESREVFQCLPEEGFLEGNLSYISDNSELLNLTFTPRFNVDYECLLVIKGLLNEEPRYLLLTGRGSFDGGHEEVVIT